LNISFIIPAYNCANTIAETVESIFAGNFGEGDEVVIVNDGSTDQTEQVLHGLQESRPSNIRIVKHERNKGGGAARNTAVRHAKHPLLFCLDADNCLAPGSVPRLKKFLLETQTDVAAFQELHYFSGNTQNVLFKWTFDAGTVSLQDHFTKYHIPSSSGNYLFTRESWERAGGYPERVRTLDTWGFGFYQVASGCKMTVMPDSFYYHRFGHESNWVREQRKGKTSLTALSIIIPYLDLIVEEDVDYIFSREGRNHWFSNLIARPIRLKHP